LQRLVDGLDEEGIEYALCGGFAMAVYGFPRPDVDIDLLAPPEDLDSFREVAARCGYSIEVQPVVFAGGAVEIRKFIKRDPASRGGLTLKLLLVTPDLRRVWSKRECVDWEGRRLCVVSRWGMIELKSLRRSPWDLEDIAGLRESQSSLP
jgi:hypothetical protein